MPGCTLVQTHELWVSLLRCTVLHIYRHITLGFGWGGLRRAGAGYDDSTRTAVMLYTGHYSGRNDGKAHGDRGQIISRK